MKEHELYWLRRIRQLPEHNMLEPLLQNAEQKHTDKRSRQCEVNEVLLDSIGARYGHTPADLFAFFLCIWKTVLYTYTSNGKFVVACPIDTAAWPQQSANSFFYPVEITSGSSFSELVFQAVAELKTARQYSRYDFTSLCGNLLRNTAYTERSLYAVACCMDDGPACPAPYQHFDFCLQIIPGEQHYSLRLWYDERCEDFLAQQLLENCFHLINTVLEHPHTSMAHISFTAGMEGYTREAMVGSPAPASTLTAWFEKKVMAMPAAIAVKYNDTMLTYQQLDRQATHIANCMMVKYGVVPGSMVGLMMHRSEKTVVAILGILKAGATYVPVDIHYPEARARYIIEDAGLSVIITDDPPLCHPYADIATLLDWEEAVRPVDTAGPTPFPDPERIAYIIYTSGSTGLPKGVQVTHANVISLLNNREFAGRFGPDDAWTLFHSVSFDFSVWEIFGALLLGGRLIVVPYETSRDMQQYLELLEKEQVTVLNIVPTVFTLLKTMVKNTALPGLRHLRYVIFGGEALEYSSLRQWVTQYPGIVLINMYGITETTVHVTFKEITLADISTGRCNIGKPLSSLYVYVMDGNMRPLPAGVRGELVIGGKGLSAGYLNKPELTSTAFISHPLARGGRLYKSGDLGSMMPNGEIIYEGRKDTQIKIRGFRIETGEIEKVLVRHADITDARVVLRKVNGESFLVAYFITTNLSGGDIKGWLKQQLPEYMVPSLLQPVLSFPVTMNGKLDLDRLPLPMVGNASVTTGEAYTPLQQELLAIWEQVLASGPLDIQQNFFEAGGHSLLANRICMEIQQRMGLKINPSQIFLYPTIGELSAVLDTNKQEQRPPSPEKSPLVSDFPASHAQMRMWSLQHLYRENHLYNIPVAYEIAGNVDMRRFGEAFGYLVRQHESLRTSFQISTDALIQVIAGPGEEDNIVCEDLCQDPRAEQRIAQYLEAEVLTGFDLSKPSLYRAKMVKTAPDRFIFFLTVHHIIADGWSIEVLINDLITFYNILLEDKIPVIRPFAIQYRDYSWWHNRLVNEKRESYRDFWSRYFAGYSSSILLAPDFPRAQVPSTSGALIELTLDTALSASLKELAASYHCSMFILLVAALDVLFLHTAGCRDITIGYPVSGRNYPEVGHLSGLFVNTQVLRTLISERETFIQLMERLQDNVLQTEKYQEYPFDLIVEDLDLQRVANRNPLFDVGFTWHAESDRRACKLAGCTITALRASQDTAKTDLWIHGTDMQGQLYLSMQYNLQLYKSSSILLLAERLKTLLEQIAKHPFSQVQDFNLSVLAMMDMAPALKIDLDL